MGRRGRSSVLASVRGRQAAIVAALIFGAFRNWVSGEFSGLTTPPPPSPLPPGPQLRRRQTSAPGNTRVRQSVRSDPTKSEGRHDEGRIPTRVVRTEAGF